MATAYVRSPALSTTARRTRDATWQALVADAAACRRCEQMDGARAVLGDANGSLDAPIVFVGEAPGRRGADQTRVPFRGDASGDRFEMMLRRAGLLRNDVFITNAVLCCPRRTGSNRRPTRDELNMCSGLLARTLALLRPRVVATLGAVALEAVGLLVGQRLCLRDVAGTIVRTDEYLLVPLYHPSPRVLAATRPFEQQVRDMRAVRRALRRRVSHDS